MGRLLPCPFCGGEVREIESDSLIGRDRIICDTCQFTSDWLARSMWNKRALSLESVREEAAEGKVPFKEWASQWYRRQHPRGPSPEALRIARDTVADPDKRAQVKVQLAANNLPKLADLIDEMTVLAREIIRLSPPESPAKEQPGE